MSDEKCPGCGSGFATPHHIRNGWHYAQCGRRRHAEHGWETMCPAGCLDRQLAQAKEENERLREWVNDLQSGMYINCVYCGHRYGPKDEVPASMADVLKEHVEQCPQHPMSKLKAIVEKLPAKEILAACALIDDADRRALAADGVVPKTAEMLRPKELQTCLSALWATREAAQAAKTAEAANAH